MSKRFSLAKVEAAENLNRWNKPLSCINNMAEGI